MSDLERQVIEPMRRVSGSIRFEFTPPRMQLASVAVKPGNRANPKGRPKLDPAIKAAKLEAKSAIVDVKAAAKENTADAIKTLKTVMNNDHAAFRCSSWSGNRHSRSRLGQANAGSSKRM